MCWPSSRAQQAGSRCCRRKDARQAEKLAPKIAAAQLDARTTRAPNFAAQLIDHCSGHGRTFRFKARGRPLFLAIAKCHRTPMKYETYKSIPPTVGACCLHNLNAPLSLGREITQAWPIVGGALT